MYSSASNLRKRRQPAILGTLLVALLGSISAPELLAEDTALGFGSGQPGTQNYEINRAIAALLKRRSIDLRLESYGGASTPLALIDSGEMSFTAILSSDLHDAVSGRGTFAANPLRNLRIVTTLITTRIGMFVSHDSGVETVRSLKGKTLAYGFSAQPSLTTMVDAILASDGLAISDVETDLVASVLDGADRLAAGRLDAALLALGAGKLIEIDTLLGGVRLLPLGGGGAAAAAVQRVSPTAVIETIEPGPRAIGVNARIPVLAYHYVLVTHLQTNSETVRLVLETIWTNVEELRSDSHLLSDLTRQHMGTHPPWDIPAHAAALAFFNDR